MERVKPFDVETTNDPSGAQYQLGAVAYQAYCDALPNGLGKTLPTYTKQFDGVNAVPDHVRYAWQMAATAVYEHIIQPTKENPMNGPGYMTLYFLAETPTPTLGEITAFSKKALKPTQEKPYAFCVEVLQTDLALMETATGVEVTE